MAQNESNTQKFIYFSNEHGFNIFVKEIKDAT